MTINCDIINEDTSSNQAWLLLLQWPAGWPF